MVSVVLSASSRSTIAVLSVVLSARRHGFMLSRAQATAHCTTHHTGRAFESRFSAN